MSVVESWQNYRVRAGLIGSFPVADSAEVVENETMKCDQALYASGAVGFSNLSQQSGSPQPLITLPYFCRIPCIEGLLIAQTSGRGLKTDVIWK